MSLFLSDEERKIFDNIGSDPLICALESFGIQQLWQIDASQKENIVITDKNSSRIWTLLYKEGIWSLEPGK